ncbi:MAG: hypothetical protein JOZ63_09390 [Planctomycetaceae bacterium]|nr:hypothetical protein [Planctomycetaceae bacterium]
MTHRGECASRPLMERKPRVELLEDRRLLSGQWQPSAPQLAPFGAAPNDSPSPRPAIPGPLDHGLVHTVDARTGGGPWDPSTSTPFGGVSPALLPPPDARPLRSFGPPGVPDGRVYTPPDFHGVIPVAIVRIIDPPALGVAPFAISTFDPGSRSPQAETASTRPPASSGETHGSQVAPVGSGANTLEVIAIPSGASAAAGAAAVDVASPGMGAGFAPSLEGLTGLAGKASVRDGRPVFDGVVEGPIASDPSGTIPEGSSAAVDPRDLAPSAVVQGADSRSGAGESSQEGEAGGLAVPSPQKSNLITDFKPFDRSSLEHAIDRFLHHFEDLGPGLSGFGRPSYLLAEVLAVTVAVLASEVVIGVLGRPSGVDAAAAEVDVAATPEGFAGLSDPWSLGES